MSRKKLNNELVNSTNDTVLALRDTYLPARLKISGMDSPFYGIVGHFADQIVQVERFCGVFYLIT